MFGTVFVIHYIKKSLKFYRGIKVMKKSIGTKFAEHSAMVFVLFTATTLGLAYYFSFVIR